MFRRSIVSFSKRKYDKGQICLDPDEIVMVATLVNVIHAKWLRLKCKTYKKYLLFGNEWQKTDLKIRAEEHYAKFKPVFGRLRMLCETKYV